MQVRVKMCGMTRVEDALAAVAAGVDAIGLIFYEGSARAVSITQAQAILAALPAFVTTVGVFVDAPAAHINAVLAALPLDLLQFHGQESAAACRQYGKPYIKTIPMQAALDWEFLLNEYTDARGLLLDTYHAGRSGGTGQPFDWRQIPRRLAKPIILAGGLTPENVAAAIQQVQPYAVDVTTGVEAAPGIKDPSKMQRFMQAVQHPE